MEKITDYEKNENFLEILKDQENFNPKDDQKYLFITTDTWLAQLGSRRNK